MVSTILFAGLLFCFSIPIASADQADIKFTVTYQDRQYNSQTGYKGYVEKPVRKARVLVNPDTTNPFTSFIRTQTDENDADSLVLEIKDQTPENQEGELRQFIRVKRSGYYWKKRE